MASLFINVAGASPRKMAECILQPERPSAQSCRPKQNLYQLPDRHYVPSWSPCFQGLLLTLGSRRPSAVDLAVGQSGLELLHPGGGDIGAIEIQPFQPEQPLQVDEPDVGDLGVGEM